MDLGFSLTQGVGKRGMTDTKKSSHVSTYTSKRRFCFSSKKKSRTNFLTKSGLRVLSITSVLPNFRKEKKTIFFGEDIE